MKGISEKYLLLTLLLIIVGCTREADYPHPEVEPLYKYPISWDITQVPVQGSRVLVTNELLKELCTPVADGTNETVGVWGEYTVELEGQNATLDAFTATPLTHGSTEPDYNAFYDWHYSGEARYWESQAIYDFRACFPQKLVTSLMTQMEPTIFQGGPINTQALQEDILLAATQVNTRTANLAQAVALHMQHIFAAVCFKVKAVDGFVPATTEGVTSCWLQNTSSATDLFSSSGYLVHSGNVNPEITWYPYESSAAPMYRWRHKGIGFSKESMLYTSNGGLEGEEFTHNDGWLLIVPQSVKAETLQFCYTLKNAGDQVFSVMIPAITYEPGKKYTYVLEIKGSQVRLNLTIAPWNYMESSYDITI